MNKNITFIGYKKLLGNIRQCIELGKKRALSATEREKVVTCWQIGKLIHEHLAKTNKSGYGTYVFKQLSKDIATSERVLYRMGNFYKTYPKMPQNNNLSWTHYRILTDIKDNKERKKLEDMSIKNQWSKRVLEFNAQKLENTTKKTTQKIQSKKIKREKIPLARGQLFTYKLINSYRNKNTLIDCGFNIYKELDIKNQDKGNIVDVTKKGKDFLIKESQMSVKKIYTYKAYIEKIVDGDTFWVIIDLGFGLYHKQRLRLRGIDAPELTTNEGKKVKNFLKAILKNIPFIIIKTYKQDKYGRYLVDIFFDQENTNAQTVANNGTLLNQLLLDEKFVIRI